MRHIPTNLSEENSENAGTRWDTENVLEKSFVYLYQRVFKHIKNSPELEVARTSIQTNFKKDESQTNRTLESLCYKLAWDLELKNIRLEDALRKRTTILLEELAGNPIPWQAIVKTIAIKPAGNQIKIGKNIVVRKPTQEDLIIEYPLDLPPSKYPFRPIIDSIIEITLLAKNANEVQDTVTRLFKILILFKVCAANYESYRIKSNTVIGGTCQLSNESHQNMEPKLTLEEKDATDLVQFYSKFEKLITQNYLYGHPEKPTEIAFKRYEASLTTIGPQEEKLTNAVMGLESLYLENEKSGLAHKLSLRTAKLLSNLNENPQTIYENLKKRITKEANTFMEK